MIEKVAAIGFEGRDKLVKGANYIADAVKMTLGPGGQNFAIEKGNRITNDGITIARELLGSQKDEIEDRGARIFVDAIGKANDVVGDGSTTCTIIGQAVLKEGIKQLPSKERMIGKMTPPQLIRKIESERKEITEKLIAMAEPIETEQQLIEVAKVSMEDETIATLIAEAQWKLGKEGVILAEEVNDRESSIEYVTGILVDNGFGTQAVVNNPEKESLEVRDVSVIYTNHTITMKEFSQQNEQGTLHPFVETINSLVKMGRKEIVLMARAFTQEAITHCLAQGKNGLMLYPLNAPYTDQAEIMQDLTAILGGRFINTDTDSLDSIQVSDVGFATNVVAKRMSTVFAGNGNPEKIEERIQNLEKKRDGSPSEFEKKNLTTRIAQLKNGFALLKIGATTDTERKYLKDKADDAVNSVRSAYQEGTLKGGGQALKEISDTLPDDYILKNALKAPYEQIMHNMGNDFVIEPWVKDSLKVTRVVLEKACSVASILATVGGAISTKKKTDECCHKS